MSSSTVIARHRSDITTTDAIRANVRIIRPRSSGEHAPQHRGGMPPPGGTAMRRLAAVAPSAITARGNGRERAGRSAGRRGVCNAAPGARAR